MINDKHFPDKEGDTTPTSPTLQRLFNPLTGEGIKPAASVTFSSPVIVTGSHSTEDSALEWMRLFGAQTEDFNGVTFVSLPENVRIESDIHTNTYTVEFASQLQDDGTYVEVLLYPNARETVVTLSMDDKYKGIRDYAAEFYNLKHKEGVLIDYTKLEYIEKSDTSEDYWEASFHVVSFVEDVTTTNVNMAFDFVDGKFVVVRGIIADHPF
jgi:hypothetical protein